MPSATTPSRASSRRIADVLRRSRAARAAERRRGLGIGAQLAEAVNALRHRRPPAQAVDWSSSAACSTCSRKSAGDDARRLVRDRSGQGAVRLRRHRRQLRQPLRAGLGLCAAAPRLRRGERQEGRLGPRHRRHGRDHAGDGAARRAGAAPRSKPTRRRARGDRREGPRRGRHPRRRRDHPRRDTSPANVNPKLLFDAAGADGGAARRNSSTAWRAGAAAPAPSG